MIISAQWHAVTISATTSIKMKMIKLLKINNHFLSQEDLNFISKVMSTNNNNSLIINTKVMTINE